MHINATVVGALLALFYFILAWVGGGHWSQSSFYYISVSVAGRKRVVRGPVYLNVVVPNLLPWAFSFGAEVAFSTEILLRLCCMFSQNYDWNVFQYRPVAECSWKRWFLWISEAVASFLKTGVFFRSTGQPCWSCCKWSEYLAPCLEEYARINPILLSVL